MAEQSRRPRAGIAGVIVAAGLIVAGVFLLPILRYHSITLPGASMAPTIEPGAHLRSESLDGAPRRGEIVLLRLPSDPGVTVVQRVVAVGGQRVSVRDGRLLLNGKPADEPYLAPGVRTNDQLRPVTVPAGTVYVLGDNRPQQIGSDYEGPIPVRDVRERVVDTDAPSTALELGLAAAGLLVAIVAALVGWRAVRQSGRNRSSASLDLPT